MRPVASLVLFECTATLRCKAQARSPSQRRKFPLARTLFFRLIASPALPFAPLLRASLVAMLYVLYASAFRKAELVACMLERKTWLRQACFLLVADWGRYYQALDDCAAQVPRASRQLARASVTPQGKWGVAARLRMPTPTCQVMQRVHSLTLN
eukprot:6214010-Pleurochrysis_carterae.AAC.4